MVMKRLLHAWRKEYGDLLGPMMLCTLLMAAVLLLVGGCELAVTITHGTP
jgi:hypothetical protein